MDEHIGRTAIKTFSFWVHVIDDPLIGDFLTLQYHKQYQNPKLTFHLGSDFIISKSPEYQSKNSQRVEKVSL